MDALLTGALALDTGAVCDLDAADFNTGVDIILYVARTATRVENYVGFLVDHKRGRHRCVDAKLREVRGGSKATSLPIRSLVSCGKKCGAPFCARFVVS